MSGQGPCCPDRRLNRKRRCAQAADTKRDPCPTTVTVGTGVSGISDSLLRCHPYLTRCAPTHAYSRPAGTRPGSVYMRDIVNEDPSPSRLLLHSARPQKPIHAVLPAAVPPPAALWEARGCATLSSSSVFNSLAWQCKGVNRHFCCFSVRICR